jgi:hypothetical protein
MAIWALLGSFSWSSTSTFQVFVFQRVAETLRKKCILTPKDYQIRDGFWESCPDASQKERSEPESKRGSLASILVELPPEPEALRDCNTNTRASSSVSCIDQLSGESGSVEADLRTGGGFKNLKKLPWQSLNNRT